MKKILVMGICIVIAAGVVGCSKNESGDTGNKGNTPIEENTEIPEVILFGKIKKIVGNQVELEIAKDPSFGWDDGNFSSEAGSEGDIDKGDVESIEGTTLVDSNESLEGAPDDEVINDMMEQNEPKLELEYVGESKEFTIPAGVKIFNLKLGKDENMTALKNGSVIRVYANGTKDSPSVVNIDIVE